MQSRQLQNIMGTSYAISRKWLAFLFAKYLYIDIYSSFKWQLDVVALTKLCQLIGHSWPHNRHFIACSLRDFALQWCHNDHDGVSNHQPHGCLLNRLFRRRSRKTSKLRVTGLCVGNSLGPVNSPHKGPVTRKMFPFDYVIMVHGFLLSIWN